MNKTNQKDRETNSINRGSTRASIRFGEREELFIHRQKSINMCAPCSSQLSRHRWFFPSFSLSSILSEIIFHAHELCTAHTEHIPAIGTMHVQLHFFLDRCRFSLVQSLASTLLLHYKFIWMSDRFLSFFSWFRRCSWCKYIIMGYNFQRVYKGKREKNFGHCNATAFRSKSFSCSGTSKKNNVFSVHVSHLELLRVSGGLIAVAASTNGTFYSNRVLGDSHTFYAHLLFISPRFVGSVSWRWNTNRTIRKWKTIAFLTISLDTFEYISTLFPMVCTECTVTDGI